MAPSPRNASDHLVDRIGGILLAWQNEQTDDEARVAAPVMALAALLGCHLWQAHEYVGDDFAKALHRTALDEIDRSIRLCEEELS